MPTPDLDVVEPPASGDLDAVQASLTDELERRWPGLRTLVDRACRHALLPAGKLFRPSLLLASASAVGGDVASVLPAAVSTECGHVASLIHDDIIDGDLVRRGRPATHSKYGVGTAIVAGDLLIFALFDALVECGDSGAISADRVAAAVRAVARAGIGLCRGQGMEAELTDGRVFDIDAYLEMVRLKTSALFRAACEAGAILGGGGRAEIEALIGYADHLGIAFQIHDDLLAYTSDDAHTGKTAASDLRNGRLVLPVLLAHARSGEAVRTEIEDCLSGGMDLDRALKTMTAILDETGAVQEAAAVARRHAHTAASHLDVLPPGRGRDLLAAYSAAAIDRVV